MKGQIVEAWHERETKKETSDSQGAALTGNEKRNVKQSRHNTNGKLKKICHTVGMRI